MIVLDLSILNQKGTPMFNSDIFANRPSAGIVGRMFISTDTFAFYRDTGTSWDLIGGPGTGTITGSGTATRLAFWDSFSSISSSANLYWDNINSRLGINNTSPGAPIDIHGAGTIAQFNGTGSNNSFLIFQNSGTSKWRIGNNYSSGTNYFSIYDNLNSSERFKITNDGQIVTIADLSVSGSPVGYNGIYNLITSNIAASTIFPSLGYVYGSGNLLSFQNFAGSATYQNNNVNSAIFGMNRIDFTGAGGIITMNQSTGVRSMNAGTFQMQYNGTNSGTITHMAGLEIYGFYRSAGSGTLSITNAYGLIINNIDDYGAGFNYTNRWGIFQEGSLDNNYFAGKVLIGTTSISTYSLDCNGTSIFRGNLATSVGNGLSVGGGSFAVTPTATRGVLNILGSTDQFLTFSTQSYIFNSSSLFRLLSTNDIDFVAGGIQRLLISQSDGTATFKNDVVINGVLKQTITTNRQTASYSLVLTDNGKLVEMNVATANTLTVPASSSVNFPIGTEINVSQYGAGATTITAGVGVTIRSLSGYLKITGQYVAVSLVKIGTDEWYCFGNLSA